MITCYLCGYEIDPCIGNPNHPGFKTRDHVRPLAMGGKSNAGNIRYAHRICNLQKGGRTPTRVVIDECRKVFLSNRYGKAVFRKLEKESFFNTGNFCVGESR